MGNPKPNMKGLTPFKPGPDKRRDGNGPKPRKHFLEDYIAVNGEDAITDLMKDVAKMAKKDFRAAQELLNRTYGKPQENIKIEGELTIEDATDKLAKILAGRGQDQDT